MKRILLLNIFLVLCLTFIYAQSELIIDENFQQWDPTEDTNPDTCELGLVHVDSFIYRDMSLVTSSGTVPISVKMMKAAISPTCGSKLYNRDGDPMPDGVSLGFVQLAKIDTVTDTIGIFVFGPIAQIDSIVFAHSATGSGRGIRIYKSYTNDTTWERATLDEFTDGNSQLGVIHKVDINDTSVYIKFTSGIKQSDETSQHSRLHNLKVYGIPGEYVTPTIIQNTRQINSTLSIYPTPASSFVNIKAPMAITKGSLEIYNLVGIRVYNQEVNQQLTKVDVSEYTQGVYIVQLKANNKVYTRQMVVK
ncbi:MAG: T9SS type A sorting domain-containing protein [Bacteroidales bacterium]|nr:T9SS type A sorting domain-containing protein [Bacteroidales bacterium]